MKRATFFWHSQGLRKPISIHTLCEEGDIFLAFSGASQTYFNPHPLWRGRHNSKNNSSKPSRFQSTPSVKRATINKVTIRLTMFNFNPHPLWRGRRISTFYPPNTNISIHTLCEEGDGLTLLTFFSVSVISIHTLCEEGDMLNKKTPPENQNFNPHPLWRGRPYFSGNSGFVFV